MFDNESEDWNAAEATRESDIAGSVKLFTRKSSDIVSDIKLNDAQDLLTMNEMSMNVSDSLDTIIYGAQDTIQKAADQLKALKTKTDNAGKDVTSELADLVSQIQDGTTNQRDKISNFLKLAADSSASELAALVQSAAAMRASLTDGQSAAYASVTALLANLQVKLAKKATAEGDVSAQVQQALQLGRSSSGAMLTANAAYQSGANRDAYGRATGAASGVLSWLQDEAVDGSDRSAGVRSDMARASKAQRAFMSASSSLTQQQAQQSVAALMKLARTNTDANGKSIGAAGAAATALLRTLTGVRGGSVSLASALSSRDGSLRSKLVAIATQLGVTEDQVTSMYAGLLKTVAKDADTSISTLMSKRLTAAKSAGGKTGALVGSAGSDIDDLTEDTEQADKAGMEMNARFKAQLGSVASSLDSQFSNRLQRDQTVRNAVRDGLAETHTALVNEATKAFAAVKERVQSYSDDTVLQLGKDLSDFHDDVAKKAKRAFNTLTDLFKQVADSKSERTGAGAALDNNFNRFAEYVASARGNIIDTNSDMDQMEVAFTGNTSGLVAALQNSSLSDLSELEQSKTDLDQFLKTVPKRISDQMKIIEESFVSTEQQLAAKAQMLQSMVNGSMSDADRASASVELANLEKSRQLMSDFKEVQRQALNQVFAKETGLLGKAGGTMGDLNNIANSVSDMLNSNQQVSDLVDQALRKSQVGSDGVTSALKDAVNGTATALQRQLDAANSQSSFSSNITSAQMGSLIGAANRDGDLANTAAADIGDMSDEQIKAKQAKLAGLAKVLQQNQAMLSEDAAKTLNKANSTNSAMQQAVEADASERATQLIIVKNAVQQLLQSWAQYADSEKRKFIRWNKTEDEYIGQYLGSMSALNQTAMTEVSKTAAAVLADKDSSESAFNQFVTFQNGLTISIDQLRDALQALNVSAEGSADQVGEEIYNVDSTDKQLDDQARATASQEASKTESDADAQAQGLMDSFTIKATSLLETDDGDNDDVLRAEVSDLERELEQD